MAQLAGYEILAKCLKAQGTKDLFFIMGGPMLDAELSCIKEGIRLIDTRHEQGAAYMAQGYSRVTQGPGVCMAASGPATLNFSTGLANALIDCCPVVALGGSSPISQFGRQVFQEIDQVAALRACVKYADRVHNLKRLPQQVNFAFQKALNGKPGPVYLDFPGDVLYTTVEEGEVDWSYMGRPIIKARPYAEPKALNALVDAIGAARQPVIVSGSGVLWSHAWDEMKAFVEKAGIPFYTTPQGRGVIPDDHPFSYLTMRNDAFRQADLIIILGTRTNYVIGHAAPPSGSRVGGRNSPTARRQSAPVPAATIRPTATSIRCGCARRSRTSCSARRSSRSTGRRSSISAASRSRPSSPATGSIPGPLARWAWGCRSRSAPRPPSPRPKSSACTATAPSGRTRWSSTPRCAT